MSEAPMAITLEHLIRELNDPRNQGAPETINVIQRQIQRLQRESAAWQIAIDLLSHDEAQMRFYGALTLTIKVNTDWDGDKVGEDRNLVAHLLECVVSNYVRLAAIPDAGYVLQKLCTTLVAIFQKVDAAWALPVRHVLASTIARRYVAQDECHDMTMLLEGNGTISGHQLRMVLLLAITMSEEMSSSSGAGKPQYINVRMANNAKDVWQLIRFCIELLNQTKTEDGDFESRYGLEVLADNDQSLSLAIATIQAIPHWTEHVKIKSTTAAATGPPSMIDNFTSSVHALTSFFSHTDLAEATLRTFTALEQNSHSLLHRVIPDFARFIIGSPSVAAWVQQLLDGDFSPDSMAYVEFLEALMGQVDVTTSTYLQQSQYVEAIKQIQQLLGCEGTAGVDDPVCQVVLEIISSVTEGYSDWDDSQLLEGEMRTLVQQACGTCLKKLQLPLSELSPASQSWDTDDRAKFQDFRYDVQDFLQNAFGILGVSLIEEIVTDTARPEADSACFEANIFALIAFSDTMNSESEKFDQYLRAVFMCSTWQSALIAESQVPQRVRQIMIKFVAENTSYLQRHGESLVSSLDFLFRSLYMETSATAASKAIFTLCDAQRAALVDALPQFMNSLETISNLEADAKARIHGSVSAIVQALPNDQSKISPLLKILEVIRADAQTLLDTSLDQQALRTHATDILYALAAIGKGLRAPSEVPVELEPTSSVNPSFWTSGPGSVVQHTALQIYRSTAEQANADEDSLFVEAVCDFLRSAFTEDHPSPFKFPPSIVLEVLNVYLHLNTPQPDIVLATASGHLASVDPADPGNGFMMLTTRISQECRTALALSRKEERTVHSDFSAAGLDFSSRLLPKWANHWLTMPNAQDIAQTTIELGLNLINDTDTMTRRAAASFFTALFEASANTKVVSDPQSSTNMNSIMQTYGPHILGAIIRLIGGECARSELESLTEPLKRCVMRQPLMANKLIREAVKEENAVLTPKALQATKPEQRARFAAQVDMLRGARKTNEIVRGFWIDCRGSSFGYVT